MLRHHGERTRGIDQVPSGETSLGRFGRLFPNVPVFRPRDEFLDALADAMVDPAGAEDDNPAIPAAWTYFGQFVDHDITFDPRSMLQRSQDPEALTNFRSPRFDLDSLYGSGPVEDPFMYDPDSAGGIELLTGRVLDAEFREIPDQHDLPRNRTRRGPGRAIIGDPRNDENVIVGQLHLAFLHFHNKVVQHVRSVETGLSDDEVFKDACRLARWIYQWIVVHEYLDLICDPAVRKAKLDEVDGLARMELRWFSPDGEPFMPVEFAAAAFRFGHSMMRPRYALNVSPVTDVALFDPAGDTNPLADLRGFRPLPEQWQIDWALYLPIDDSQPQASRKINTRLAAPLFALPGETDEILRSLARRNLRRGKALELPSGRRVARAMNLEPLSREVLGFREPPPLWFYALKEAEAKQGGVRLGELGSEIVCEVLVGLLAHDPLSYPNVEPGWTPAREPLEPGNVVIDSLATLLKFAVPERTVRR